MKITPYHRLAFQLIISFGKLAKGAQKMFLILKKTFHNQSKIASIPAQFGLHCM